MYANPDNPQTGHVGNEGDILKHAALFVLADRLRQLHPAESVTCLETHAFQREAPLANPDWQTQTDMLCTKFDGYYGYRALQLPYVRQQHYLCSTGITNTVLQNADNILYESDPHTRTTLEQQMKQHGNRINMPGTDNRELDELPAIITDQPLLALIDPFRQTPDLVANSLLLLSQTGKSIDTIVLLFDCNDNATAAWPVVTSAGMHMAVLDQAPWHLACYWRGQNSTEFSRALAALGWQTAAC